MAKPMAVAFQTFSGHKFSARIADAGQTAASKASFDLLKKIAPEAVLFAGPMWSWGNGFSIGNKQAGTI
jgi:hypothetical protein